MEQPIVSLSMGSSAVFLLGGRTRDKAPLPILIRSGDVVVMGRQSRLCYHGVCVRPTEAQPQLFHPCPLVVTHCSASARRPPSPSCLMVMQALRPSCLTQPRGPCWSTAATRKKRQCPRPTGRCWPASCPRHASTSTSGRCECTRRGRRGGSESSTCERMARRGREGGEWGSGRFD